MVVFKMGDAIVANSTYLADGEEVRRIVRRIRDIAQLDYLSMLASHPSYSPPSLVVNAFMRSVVAKTLDCDGTVCVSAMHEKVLEPNNFSQIEVGGLR
jgi:hypothetical protein